jgi:hypothetical protein
MDASIVTHQVANFLLVALTLHRSSKTRPTKNNVSVYLTMNTAPSHLTFAMLTNTHLYSFSVFNTMSDNKTTSNKSKPGTVAKTAAATKAAAAAAKEQEKQSASSSSTPTAATTTQTLKNTEEVDKTNEIKHTTTSDVVDADVDATKSKKSVDHFPWKVYGADVVKIIVNGVTSESSVTAAQHFDDIRKFCAERGVNPPGMSTCGNHIAEVRKVGFAARQAATTFSEKVGKEIESIDAQDVKHIIKTNASLDLALNVFADSPDKKTAIVLELLRCEWPVPKALKPNTQTKAAAPAAAAASATTSAGVPRTTHTTTSSSSSSSKRTLPPYPSYSSHGPPPPPPYYYPSQSSSSSSSYNMLEARKSAMLASKVEYLEAEIAVMRERMDALEAIVKRSKSDDEEEEALDVDIMGDGVGLDDDDAM